MHPAVSMLSACIQPSECIQLYESMLVPALPAWAYTRALTFENPCRNSTTAATVRRKGKAAPGRRGVMGRGVMGRGRTAMMLEGKRWCIRTTFGRVRRRRTRTKGAMTLSRHTFRSPLHSSFT